MRRKMARKMYYYWRWGRYRQKTPQFGRQNTWGGALDISMGGESHCRPLSFCSGVFRSSLLVFLFCFVLLFIFRLSFLLLPRGPFLCSHFWSLGRPRFHPCVFHFVNLSSFFYPLPSFDIQFFYSYCFNSVCFFIASLNFFPPPIRPFIIHVMMF